MPVNIDLSTEVWNRYQYLRDNGHNLFVEKADQCDKFFQGQQWSPIDLAKLKSQRRPALTINKILSTISNVLGEQINNRTDISFQPRTGSPSEVAEALSLVFRQIADNNQLDWLRSDMFTDGVITSRGFLDVRLDFDDSMMGEIRISLINPKNVLIDSDAEDYDPEHWNDVIITKWMTHEDIAVLYSKADAKLLENRSESWFQYGFDSIERFRDRFGTETQNPVVPYGADLTQSNMLRNIRVIERQHRKIAKVRYFVAPDTGDMREVPEAWDRNKIAAVAEQFGFSVIEKLAKRIKWTTIADNVELHNEWSPYEHFTVVPYFPYFRRGKTLGLVENLLGPQELLNKVASQELHVVNTTANSGWKIKTGSLRNLSIEELEQRGAETGLVMELDDVASAEKIQPNQVPSGLDRITYKAEEHIKTISGVSDYQTGQAREDVSAKAVALNQQRGAMNNAKSTDSLNRTDYILARNVLSLVQRFYTEPRLISITKNKLTGEQQTMGVNQPTPEGEIANDLTLGEYDIVVLSTPHKATFEQGQFEQAQALKELGLPIPDDILIEHSQLHRKGEIIRAMQEQKNSEEEQYKLQIQKMQAELELANLRAEAERMEADAALKKAKTQHESVKASKELEGDDGQAEMAKLEMEMEKMREELKIERERMEMELEFKRQELEFKRQELELKLEATRATTESKLEQTQMMGEVKQVQAAQQMEQSEQQHQQSLELGQSQHQQALKQGDEMTKAKIQQTRAMAKAKPASADKGAKK
jgi:hypothetical protein